MLLSSEYGTYEADQARFRPWVSGERPERLASWSLFARKRNSHTVFEFWFSWNFGGGGGDVLTHVKGLGFGVQVLAFWI